jgi:hypothetical protein
MQRWAHKKTGEGIGALPRRHRRQPFAEDPSMSMSMVAYVRDFAKSTGYAKFLLQTIASHVNPTLGYAEVSIHTLAHEVTISTGYVVKLTRALEVLGELEVERHRGREQCHRYRIPMHQEVSTGLHKSSLQSEVKSARKVHSPPQKSSLHSETKVKALEREKQDAGSLASPERHPHASHPWWCPDCHEIRQHCPHRTMAPGGA